MKFKQLHPVEWFLGFAALDIEGLDQEAMIRLLMDVDTALWGGMSSGAARMMSPFFLQREWARKPDFRIFLKKKIEEAKGLQNRLKAFLDKFFATILRSRAQENVPLDVESFEELSRFPDITVSKVTLGAYIEAESFMIEDGEGQVVPPPREYWPSGALDKAVVKVTRGLPRDPNAFIFRFLEALDDVPLRRFQQCQECERWFFQSTEREQKYCSPKCAKRRISRKAYNERKKKDPEGYEKVLERKREKAHERYAQQKEEEVPGAKVVRRPRKKQRKEA